MIFDTHCHLNSPELFERLDEVLSNAEKNNVGFFMIVGWDKESSIMACKLASEIPNAFAAVGYHPCNTENVSDSEYQKTIELSSLKNVKAIGEIGLDYYWEKSEEKRKLQQQWFIKQIDAANSLNKPIIVHCRDALGDCLKILKDHTPKCGGIMHCYSGSVETMKEILNLGMVVGLGGPLTFKNAKTPKDVCLEVPLDKLVFETDCPYLSPHPLRGTINEPGNVALVVQEAANIKNISVVEIIEATTTNAKRIFDIK